MYSPTCVEERIAAFPELCRSDGLKVTQQRVAIYNWLAGTASHPSPEEVFEALRGEQPRLSLATVYKVLDILHRRGFLRKVATENQVSRYDANMGPHHHLVCERCGDIQDVPTLPGAESVLGQACNDFAVSHYDVIFYGQCAPCRIAGPSQTPQQPDSAH